MANLAIYLLGTFQVTHGSTPVTEFASNKVRGLLAYLAVESNRPHPRDALAALLWPESSQDQALGSLRNALANLRRVIGDREANPPYLLITREMVKFNHACDYHLDAEDILRLETGFQPPTFPCQSDDIERRIAALDGYHGPFLAGFSIPDSAAFEEWASLWRERLGRMALEGLRWLADQYEACGEYVRALEYAQRQVALDPWLEEGHRQVMRILALSGQRGAALAQYEICRQALAVGLGVEPSEETRRLYEAVLAGELENLHPGQVLPAPGISPYRGLCFFDESDADLFFGREVLVARLVERVREMARSVAGDPPVLAVVGASGSGKSSLVRAGVVPALRMAGWVVRVITPTAYPLQMLEPHGDWNLLVIDQFEELFSLCREESQREAFLDRVFELSLPLILLLRADFYGHCAAYPRLRAAFSARQEYIGAMEFAGLRRAIEEPARRGGWELEPGLVDLLLRDVGASGDHMPEPGALPLLSHALLETWKRRRGRTMTLKGYTEAGGVRGAIARTADIVFGRLEAAQQAQVRRIFLRLTELGENTQDTRRRVSLSELITRPSESGETRELLMILADARLVTLTQEGAEVAHEALIREWPTLRDWLSEDREGLRLHRHLTVQALAWEKGNRDPGDLYRGIRLSQATEWIQQTDHARELNDLEIEFLNSSQEQAERENAEREENARRELEAARRLSEKEQERALVAQTSFARELASQAELKLSSDPELSLLLALRAVSEAQLAGGPIPWEVQQALHDAVANFRLLYTFSDLDQTPWGLAYSPDGKIIAYYTSPYYKVLARDALTGQLLHEFPDHSGFGGLAFSPDGKFLATGTEDNTVIFWHAGTWQPVLTLTDPVKAPCGLAFSPAGDFLAVANGIDMNATIWDLRSWFSAGYPPGATLNEPILALGHYGGIEGFKGITFSPDGKWVATVFQNNAILWDAASGKELRTFTGHTAIVFDLDFNPDGTRLVTAGYDSCARIWDTITGAELLSLRGHDGVLTAAKFSPDGSRAATSADDGKAILWDPGDGRKLFELPGRGQVHDIAFSPDGSRLVTTHEDRYGRVWDVTPAGRGELRVTPNQVIISAVQSSLDRSCFASVTDGVVHIIHAAILQERLALQLLKPVSSESDAIYDLAFSADNEMLAVAQGENGVTLWDLACGRFLCRLPFPVSARAVAFSPTGRRLAVSGLYKHVKIWDLSDIKTCRELGMIEVPITGKNIVVDVLAFSPDGTRLAASGSGVLERDIGPVFIWEVSDRIEETRPARICGGDMRQTTSLAFSPDGRTLASCGSEGLAKLWDVTSGRQIGQLAGHNAFVMKINYSPDGKYLGTASFDRTARIWDATDGKELLSYRLPDVALGAFFTPDGQRVIVVPETGGYHLNAFLEIDELVEVARQRVTRDWNPEERRRYLREEI